MIISIWKNLMFVLVNATQEALSVALAAKKTTTMHTNVNIVNDSFIQFYFHQQYRLVFWQIYDWVHVHACNLHFSGLQNRQQLRTT